jgi:hypothetical protein
MSARPGQPADLKSSGGSDSPVPVVRPRRAGGEGRGLDSADGPGASRRASRRAPRRLPRTRSSAPASAAAAGQFRGQADRRRSSGCERRQASAGSGRAARASSAAQSLPGRRRPNRGQRRPSGDGGQRVRRRRQAASLAGLRRRRARARGWRRLEGGRDVRVRPVDGERKGAIVPPVDDTSEAAVAVGRRRRCRRTRRARRGREAEASSILRTWAATPASASWCPACSGGEASAARGPPRPPGAACRRERRVEPFRRREVLGTGAAPRSGCRPRWARPSST